jgi:hypothetical protein
MGPRVGLRFPCILGLSYFSACTGVEDPVPEFTVDQRLDGAEGQNDPESFGTKMCVADDGTVYVIWLDNRANPTQDRNDIWMQRSLNLGEPGSWFTQPVKVNQGSPDAPSDAFNPDLFCNDIGAFVVWEDDRDGELQNHQIYFNRTTDQGETFLPQDILIEDDDDGNTMSLEPKLIGNASTLYTVWYDSKNGAYDIFMSSSSNAGESWDSPLRVDSDAPAGSAYSARPQVAASTVSDADVWIAWEDSRDGASDIYFSRSETGGTTFTADVRLDTGDDEGLTDSFEPQLCSDGDSVVYVVWHDSKANDLNRDIYANFSANRGENWLATAQRLDGSKDPVEPEGIIKDAPGFGNSLFPKCVVTDLTAHVVWYDQVNEGEGYDIYYRSLTGGLPDGEAARRLDLGQDDANPEPQGFANSTAPLMGADGTTMAVLWSDGRNDNSANPSGYVDLFYSYANVETAGQFPLRDFRVDSMWDAASYKIDVDMDVLGEKLFTVWIDGRNGTGDVYFTTLQVGEESDPPSEAVTAR